MKAKFYKKINSIITQGKYRILASAKQSTLKNMVSYPMMFYEIALSFIIERAIFCLDEKKNETKQLEIIIEKRGKKEDKRLDEHFQRLLARGTGYVSAERLQEVQTHILFQDKKENSNGLQLTDLLAYPIARYVIEPKRANPAFDVLQNKIYKKGTKRYGLKIFP